MIRATRWYRQALKNLRPATRRRRARLQFEALEIRDVPSVTGTVFVDLNQDGIQDLEDTGAAGVTVVATDSTGVVEVTQTDANGLYELLTVADDVRIDFSGFPENTFPGRVTGTTGATVRFLDATSDRDMVDLALTSPMLVTTQFYYDDALEGMNSGEAAVLAVPYSSSDFLSPTVLATVSDVGSVWGLAYQPSSNSVYTSSFVKRHAGLGPNASGLNTTTGGIYRIDRSTDPATVSLLVDLNAAGTGFGAGADPHPTNPEGAATSSDWFHDSATMAQVGKRGLGGLQLSPDGRSLYVVNLNTKALVEIPLNTDGTRNTARSLRTIPVPSTNPSTGGITGFSTADLRPFAVAVRGNAVFVGVTHTAETSRNLASLRAYVYAFDPSQGAFRTYNQNTGVFATSGAATPVLIANLNYPRGVADDLTPGEPGDEVSANWTPWTSTFVTSRGNEGSPVQPSPWLTDIEFDGDAMVLAIRDRFGDQGGFQTGNTAAGSEDTFSVIASGDILRAGSNPNGGWVLESGGKLGATATTGLANGQGPGGGEFYYEDNADPSPDDVGMGALAQVPGFRTIAMTGNDPGSPFAGGIYTLLNSDSGTGPTRRPAGSVFSLTQVFASFDSNTFGSANGLGDLEYLPAIGTAQAGNRVFSDVNSNGLQDAGEAGISGVSLRLFKGGTQVDHVATGSGGDFLFDDLLPNTTYQIRLDMNQGALGGATLTRAKFGTNDDLDSDAIQSGSTASVAFTTGTAGTSNNSLDVGLRLGVLAFSITIGDLVYLDNNASGTFDAGDAAIPDVDVELLDSLGVPVAGQTDTTDADGLYSFTALDDGTYSVRLAASNFLDGGVLFNHTATSPSLDPDNDVDHDNNGSVSGTLGSEGFIVSGQIDVAEGTEPGDSNTNNTLDFGLVPPLTLGDLVWNDLDNDGTFDVGTEAGISGVLVELLDSTGAPTGQTDTTDANGLYSFTGLTAGTYAARLAALNFNNGNVLFGFTSSSTSSANANDNANNDDNGIANVTNGPLGNGGVIESGSISLAVGAEPIDDGDTDNDTNLTLDFGVVAPVAPSLTLGNLVWNDVDNDGTRDAGSETGIDGVLVELLDRTGDLVPGQTTTTSGGGLYTFTGLAPESYRVRLASSNFKTGGTLVNFTSSAFTSVNPEDDVDDNDDGGVSGTLGNDGFILSGLITLEDNFEPIDDGDTNNDTNLSLDFGVLNTAATGNLTLGNAVFGDTDNDGVFDGTEAGVEGVRVELLDGTGTPIAGRTATTTAIGTYSFTGLLPGAYKVRLAASNFNTGSPLFNFTSSAFTESNPDSNANNDDNGSASGTLGSGGFIVSGTINLSAGEEPITDGDSDTNTNMTLDFGVVAPVISTTMTVGSTVWNDTNNDGVLNNGEIGLAGIAVRLVGLTGTIIQSTTTTASGAYTFTGVAAGNYRVRLASTNFTGSGILSGFTSSTGTNGSLTGSFEGSATPDPDINTTDSDDNGQVVGTLGQTGGSIETALFTLASGTEPIDDGDVDPSTNLAIDLGVFRKFSIGNVVFNDADNDGTQDTGESGVTGVSIRLLDADNANALVSTTTTDSQGRYLFQALADGNYVVELAATNFNMGGPLFAFQSSTGGTGTPFEPAPPTAIDKRDHGTRNGVLASGGTIRSGTIVLGPTANAPTLENPNNDPGTPDNQSNLRIDFGVFQPTPTTGSIAGRVFLDYNDSGTLNGPDVGMSGVTITLAGGNLIVPITTTTDGSGNFKFSELAAGTYTVTETQPTTPTNQNGRTKAGSAGGNAAVTNVISSVVLANNQQATNYLFTEIPILTTGGFVYEDTNGNGIKNSGEPGIPGVVITLTGTSVITGAIAPRTFTTIANGSYTFDNLTPGTYSISEAQPAEFIDGQETNGTPPAGSVTNDKFNNINFTTSAATGGGFNFGEVKTGGIAGVVYDDVNDDGNQEATGEDGIAGVTIRVQGTNDRGQAINRTTTTGANGAYSFADLRPGTYRLTETQPKGYVDGTDKVGTANGTANTAQNQITNIVLTSGSAATDYLFGELATADVVVSQSPASVRVNVRGKVTITYTVKNRGTAVADDVSLVVNYGGMTFVSANTDNFDYDEDFRKWTIGDLAPGETAVVRLRLRAGRTATFGPSSRVTTTSDEISESNNTATSSIFAGVYAPVSATGGFSWFLSSSMNARRS